MKYLVIAAIVIAVVIALLLRRLRAVPAGFNPPKTNDITVLAPWFAQQAVLEAEEIYGVHLDYSDPSVDSVEEILGKVHESVDDPERPPKGVRGTATMYGFYIGECILRHHGPGRWDRDSDVGGKDSFPVIYHGKQSFPVGWAVKRVLNGPEDNVAHKYRVFILQDVDDSAAVTFGADGS